MTLLLLVLIILAVALAPLRDRYPWGRWPAGIVGMALIVFATLALLGWF